jgi:hypothetical protein
LELERDAVVWSSFVEGPEKLHYNEHHSVGASAQLYDQKKTVASQPNPPRGKRSCHNNRSEGYADYRPGKGYISCWSVQVCAGGASAPLRAMGGGRLRGQIKALGDGAGRIAPSEETGGGDFEDGVAFDSAALAEGTRIAPAAVGAEVEYELERRADATVAVRVVVVALAVEAAAAQRVRKRARAEGAGCTAAAAPKPAKRREGRGVAPRLSLLALFPGARAVDSAASAGAAAAPVACGAAAAGADADAGAGADAARALIVHMFASKALKRIAERLKRWYRSAHCRSEEMSKADALEQRSVAGAPAWLLSVRRGAVVAPMERRPLLDPSPDGLADALVEFLAARLAAGNSDAGNSDAVRSVVIVDCNPEAGHEALNPALVARLRACFPALRAAAVVGASAAPLDALLAVGVGVGAAVPVDAFVFAGSDAARGFAQRSARAAAMKRLRAAPHVATITYVASVFERGDVASNGVDNMVEEIVALCGPELRPSAPATQTAARSAADGAANDAAQAAAPAGATAGVRSSALQPAAPPCFVPIRCALRDASQDVEVRCTLFLHCVRADSARVATLATADARAYCWTCGAIGDASPCDPSARHCAARVAWKSVA